MSLPEPKPPFRWIPTPWGDSLVCEALMPLARHVFSARGLDVPHADGGDGWVRLAEYLRVDAGRVWRMRQVHGVVAHTDAVDTQDGGWPEGDLVATDRRDVALTVRTADCVPLLYADPRRGVVAAVHAGWRGSVAGAASRMVKVLESRFGSRPEDLTVAVGPSIGPDAYEVGQEVVDAFARAWPSDAAGGAWWRESETPGKYLLDLWRVTHDQLAHVGVRPEKVHVAGLCTARHADIFHSYRVHGAAAGRMVAAVAAGHAP